jgi:hypothetical protein
MRKLTYGAACSLDGYLARSDDQVDWLRWSKDVQRITDYPFFSTPQLKRGPLASADVSSARRSSPP